MRGDGSGRYVMQSGYVGVWMPDHPNAMADGTVLEHVLVVSRALGGAVPKGAVVHHVNGDKSDNRPQNLVLCPDDTYHRLLHRRQGSMDAIGDPNGRRCKYCKQWDHPQNVVISKDRRQEVAYHADCRRAYARKRAAVRRATDPTWAARERERKRAWKRGKPE